MSSIKTLTLDVSNWSNEKVCEFLDWLEMFEDHQPGKETCFSLKEEYATMSKDLDTSETTQDLKESKEILDEINTSTPPDEVLDLLVKALIEKHRTAFSRFLRQFIQETIVELTEQYPDGGKKMGMILTKELNEIKGGRDLQNPDDALMTSLLTSLCGFRHDRSLPYLTENDQDLLKEQIKEAA